MVEPTRYDGVARSLNQRVADGLRAELARTQTTQEALARHLGLSVTAFRRRMNDEVSFTVWEVEAACEFFNMKPNELVRTELALDSVRIIATEVYVEKTR